MRIIVDPAWSEGKQHQKIEVASYQTDSPDLFIGVIKLQLKAAQAIWPKLNDVMIVDKFERREA